MSLRYKHPEFKSQLKDLSRSHPPLSLPLHFLSALHCRIIINTKHRKEWREDGSLVHTDGDWEQFGQADEALDNAGGVGVEELDPLYVLSAVRVEGMPDKVPGHVNVKKGLLEVEEGHVYWLVILPVPLQQQPDGVDYISSPASSNKSTLIGTKGDGLPETGIDYAISYKFLWSH